MKTKFAGAAITGMGVICPIGHDIAAMRDSLAASRGGIGEIGLFSTAGLSVHHAGEVRGFDPLAHFSAAQAGTLDRTAQLAIVAARQAVADARLQRDDLASARVGLVMGICAGGIGDGSVGRPPAEWTSRDHVHQQLYATAHFCQTEAVAADLGVTGPCLTVSTACASSTSALASALTLLGSGQVDAVIVGGADAFSLANYACFYSVGAMSSQPASPFSTDVGISCGEGAGCIVLESEQRVGARAARVHGMLLACASTSDAHHVTAPHPAGDGLRRAMQLAIADAALTPASIQYINTHGTGTHDNDIAETLAIRALYKDALEVPPASSSKSFFGHLLGGTGIVEFIAALLGLQHDFLPPTLHFKAARPGCDLDYVPNTARPARFDTFLSSSAAFGGVNAVAVGARAGTPLRQLPQAADIVITGLGTLSPIGAGIDAFHRGLLDGSSGIVPLAQAGRFDDAGLRCRHAGLVPAFSPRQLAPMVDVRRMDGLTRYAVIAAAMAMKDAGLSAQAAPQRIGLHVAMTRGPLASQQAFQESLARDGIAGLAPKHFPAIVLSTVSGQITLACQIKGASFTFVGAADVGLQALMHGRDYLALHPELDAVVVVAVDEIGALYQHLFDYLGLLAPATAMPALYGADRTDGTDGTDGTNGGGTILGEGAVAVVLERATCASARGARAYARISGAAMGRSAGVAGDADGHGLEAVARRAIAASGTLPDVVYGMAHGARAYDRSEALAVGRLLAGRAAPLVCLNGQLGLAEASGSLFAVCAALLGMRHGEAYRSLGSELAPAGLPLQRGATMHGQFADTLVLAGSRHGNQAALMFSHLAGAP